MRDIAIEAAYIQRDLISRSNKELASKRSDDSKGVAVDVIAAPYKTNSVNKASFDEVQIGRLNTTTITSQRNQRRKPGRPIGSHMNSSTCLGGRLEKPINIYSASWSSKARGFVVIYHNPAVDVSDFKVARHFSARRHGNREKCEVACRTFVAVSWMMLV